MPLLHVGARYYDPSAGRFLQRDPLGIDGGSNAYDYVDSQPTLAIDPSGLCSRCGGQFKNTVHDLGRSMTPLERAHMFLDLTGGKRKRWYDDKKTVDTVALCADIFSWAAVPPAIKAATKYKWALWGLKGIQKIFGL